MRTNVMRIFKPTRLSSLALALAGSVTLLGCGSTSIPSSNNAAAEKDNDLIPGENKPNAAEIIPKEQKRQISADARADFEKATQRYAEAKKSGGSLSGSECRSVASAFKNAADENPNLLEARFNQGAVLAECGNEDEAVKIWEGMPKYGPAVANLGYVAWKAGDTGKAESLFSKAIEVDPLHTVEARNNLAQILRDKARRSDGAEKKQYIQSAVSNLRTVLAIDSNNLQAFSTLAFIYYDMNMLEMAKLVGNQAIKKADEIATGKFEEEKVAAGDDSGEGKGKKGKGKKGKGDKEEDEPGVKSVDVREAGTGVTPEMKKQLAVVRNTLGLVELKKGNISPAIKQFKEAVALDPNFAEARLNLAALSLNNRDYATAEENFREALKMQPKNYEASIGLGVALRGNKKIDDAETQYLAAQKLDSSNPSSYYNLGLLYQDYKDGQKPALHKAQDYYRQFLSHASGSTPGSLKRDAEKRIKDIDEIYVALDEAAKMQAEAEEMQRKAEEQQKQMEEQMKKQDAEEKAAAQKNSDAKGDKDAKPGTEPPAATTPPAPGAEGAAAPADNGGKKKKGKK